MKKPLSVFLAFLIVGMLLVSCANEDISSEQSESTAEDTAVETTVPETTVETDREDAKDNLPEDLKFQGEVISVIYRNHSTYERWDMIGADNSGEIVQDAIWERNRRVEERFGITLNLQPSQSDNLAELRKQLMDLVLADSPEYDIFSTTANSTVQNSMYPYMHEISEMNYIDISQPWWRKNAIESLSLDGEHYRFLLGDHLLFGLQRCGVMYYNKELYPIITTEDADALYQVVLDGKWTWDYVAELITLAYSDLNGDGTQNYGDRFGLILPKGLTEATLHMVYSCDPVDMVRTADGGIDLSGINNEKNIAIIDLLNKVCHNPVGAVETDQGIDNLNKYFKQDISLLMAGRLSAVTGMRDMESDYGILPMPKYDEAQEEYVTLMHDSVSASCVPKTVPNDRLDMVAAVLEGWAAEGYRTVVTPFLETALKSKYSRDAMSGQVIDLILENPIISFTSMYEAQVNKIINNVFLKNIASGENNFASSIASVLSAGQSQLDTYLAEMKKAEQ